MGLAAYVTGNALYQRGAAMLHTLRMQLGDARWRQLIVGVLVNLLPKINAEFGLSAEQIERLAPGVAGHADL